MEQDKDILMDEELTARIHDIVWQVNKSWNTTDILKALSLKLLTRMERSSIWTSKTSRR